MRTWKNDSIFPLSLSTAKGCLKGSGDLGSRQDLAGQIPVEIAHWQGLQLVNYLLQGEK